MLCLRKTTEMEKAESKIYIQHWLGHNCPLLVWWRVAVSGEGELSQVRGAVSVGVNI